MNIRALRKGVGHEALVTDPLSPSFSSSSASNPTLHPHLSHLPSVHTPHLLILRLVLHPSPYHQTLVATPLPSLYPSLSPLPLRHDWRFTTLSRNHPAPPGCVDLLQSPAWILFDAVLAPAFHSHHQPPHPHTPPASHLPHTVPGLSSTPASPIGPMSCPQASPALPTSP